MFHGNGPNVNGTGCCGVKINENTIYVSYMFVELLCHIVLYYRELQTQRVALSIIPANVWTGLSALQLL